jgi:deglycase
MGGRAAPVDCRLPCGGPGRRSPDDRFRVEGVSGMPAELDGLTVAFLVAPEGFEQLELTEPWKAVERAGGVPKLISTKAGEVQGFDHLEQADTFHVDAGIDAVGSGDFDALVLPGGVANPDFLRTQPKAVEFARRFFEEGKPVAVICHGPWTLIEADVVRGRTITSWPSLRTDLENAGATWIDEAVVVCTAGRNTLISSRKPADLPAFDKALVTELAMVGKQR